MQDTIQELLLLCRRLYRVVRRYLQKFVSYFKRAQADLAGDASAAPASDPEGSSAKPMDRFENEKRLIGGVPFIRNTRQSVLFYTIRKGASVYVWEILKAIGNDVGLIPIDFAGYCFDHQVDRDTILRINEQGPDLFKDTGCLYGPFRDPLPVTMEWIRSPYEEQIGIYDLSRFKVVLMLRDPRDALVSLYFSLAYSHPLPGTNPEMRDHFLRKRAQTLASGIDQFVLDWAEGFHMRYRVYCEKLLGKPNVHFLKYEEMVENFPLWLKSLEAFLCLEILPSTRQALIDKANFSVAENVQEHKRQVTPGDHRRKLKPETIESLNRHFEYPLRCLGYVD